LLKIRQKSLSPHNLFRFYGHKTELNANAATCSDGLAEKLYLPELLSLLEAARPVDTAF